MDEKQETFMYRTQPLLDIKEYIQLRNCNAKWTQCGWETEAPPIFLEGLCALEALSHYLGEQSIRMFQLGPFFLLSTLCLRISLPTCQFTEYIHGCIHSLSLRWGLPILETQACSLPTWGLYTQEAPVSVSTLYLGDFNPFHLPGEGCIVRISSFIAYSAVSSLLVALLKDICMGDSRPGK